MAVDGKAVGKDVGHEEDEDVGDTRLGIKVGT
jgi:hypothetical protein